jgi:curved DNA-binding protein CbpA
MGNSQSSIDPVHLRIYSNIIQINDPIKRIQMINTCLTSMEYISSAKRAGIYSYLLNYIAVVNSGGKTPLLPGEQHITTNTTTVPRSLQSMPHTFTQTGPGATHPSLINAQTASSYSQRQTQIITHSDTTPSWKVITDTPKQKAMTYFASCLEVLGIQEEVALTDESLKSAYKKMALRAHPDKGGSEEYFEAVTRAYAYLSEIIKHMKGGKRDFNGRVEAPSSVNMSRDADAEKWKHVEPVRLSAKNLDMNAFNKLFEQTHIPDPDSDGYGDWLKGSDTRSAAPKFGGEFNRDVFNRMFDEESKKNHRSNNSLIVHPGEMALTLNPTSGVDLVGERPSSYTAAPNSKFQFTDLRGAYTSDSTISDKVSNVQVGERNLEQYRASRERAPDPFTQTELHGIREFENRQKQMDEMRERKRAEMSVRNQQYFDKMKQMVITDGVDLNQKKLTY